jgi:hypothetical protein
LFVLFLVSPKIPQEGARLFHGTGTGNVANTVLTSIFVVRNMAALVQGQQGSLAAYVLH